MSTPKTPIVGWIATVLGLCLYVAHMVLKYVVHQPIPMLLWIGLGFIVIGMLLRRVGRG